jgi:hypothetical protein
MREQPDPEHFLVTLERYSQQWKSGDLSYSRHSTLERAGSYVDTQMSSGAFVRATIDRVKCVKCYTWQEFLNRRQ